MKRFFISSKLMAIVGGFAMLAITGLSYTNYQLGSKDSAVKDLSSGVGTCFQRVSQTFTALMIRDFSSNYLNPSFKSSTGECFNEVSKGFTALGLTDKKIVRTLKNLSSDLHWFHTKMDKVVDLAQRDGIDLLQSNIVSKFSDLEDLTTDVNNYLQNSSDSNLRSKQLSLLGIVLAQFALLFSLVNILISRKKFSKEISNIDIMAKHLDESLSLEARRDGVQKIVESTFAKLGMPESAKITSQLIHDLADSKEQSFTDTDFSTPDQVEMIHVIDENFNSETVSQKVNVPFEFDFNKTQVNLEADALEPSSIRSELSVSEIDEEGVSFSRSLNLVLDKMQKRAFTNGVVLDTNLSDNFGVCASEEALEQLLFYTLSFAMDSSLEHSESRRIILRSKPLGGVAYCKIRIANHAFTDSELSVFNGKDVSDQVNVNLILLKELLEDSNATVAVKNKQNQLTGSMESEIEFIFERSLSHKSDLPLRKEVNIVKGSKEDIKQFFQQNLS